MRKLTTFPPQIKLVNLFIIVAIAIGLFSFFKYHQTNPKSLQQKVSYETKVVQKINAISNIPKTANLSTQPESIANSSTSNPIKKLQPVLPVSGKTEVIKAFDAELSDWKGKFDAGIRSREVLLENEFLRKRPIQEGRELSFRIFDDVQVDAVVTKSFENVNGTISTTAKIKGSKWGRVFMASTQGQLQARIRVPEENKIYAIEYNHKTGSYNSLELDIALAEPPEGDDELKAPPLPQKDQTGSNSPPVMAGDEAVDSSYVVEVMVAYSDDALIAAGSQAAMDNQIALGIAYANDAHENTGTMIVFYLVYSYEHTYTETGSNATDLYWFDGDATVAANRNTYGADFCIFMNATGSGGIAWVMTQNSGRPDLAFCVVDDNSFVSYTPGHEVGHNMGLSHAADQNYQPGPTGGDFGNYSAGWHWHPTPGAAGFCSVMTYTSGTYFADGLDHTRVGLFSDPDLSDHGEVAGDATSGDNARVLTAMRGVYVTYRDRNIGSNVIQVDYPNGGETLTAESPYTINWDSNGVSGNVKIDLYKSGSFDRQIVASTLNDRVYSWTVPSDVGGTGYSIKISNLTETITDLSDASFAVNKTFYNEPLNSDPGYTKTGTWEYGVPVAINNVTYGGPGEAYTGTNIYDTDLDYVSFIDSNLTTTAIDCSNYEDVTLSFMGQFSVSDGDYAKVQVSNNGTDWTDLYSATNLWSTSWAPYEYNISAVADGESTVYIRWAYDDATVSSRSGMAVDDINVKGILTVPPAGTVEFSSATYNVAENGTTATITVKRVNGSAGAISVDYATSNGSAIAGIDYTTANGTLNWAAGNSDDKTFTITITDDALDENDETVVVSLSNPSGTTISGTNPATLTITDNDDPPTVTLAVNNANIAEAAGVATFTATIAPVSGRDVTVNLGYTGTATGGGTDYTASGTQIVISAGDTTGTVTVTADQDALDEDDETVIVDITSVVNGTENGTQQQTTTITDDDALPTVTFTSASQASSDETGTMTITAQLSALSGRDVSVPFTVNGTSSATGSGTDYSISASPLTITAGNTTGDITITITADTLDENNETVIVDMGAPANATQGATTSHTATITDDDAEPTVTLSVDNANIAEAGGVATFTATLSAPSGRPVSVNLALSGTASGGGVDYTSGAPLIGIAPGGTTGTFTVTADQDAFDENNETVIVDITSCTYAFENGTQQATTTIVDDDVAGFTFNPAAGLTTTEGSGTDTFTVVLDSEPTADVEIGIASSDTTEGTVDKATLTFTAGDWDTPQTVTVTGVNDDIDDGDVAYTIVTAAATSADPFYNSLNPADVSVTNTDDADNKGVTVTGGPLTTGEDGTVDTFTVVLDSEPTANVTIPISSSDTTEGTVSPSSLLFTSANWDTPQTVTVTGVDDALDDGDIAYTVVTGAGVSTDPNYSNIAVADVAVTNTDDDAVGITVAPTNGLITDESGGQATFTVVLNTQPSADVTIGLSSDNTGEGTVAPASLKFTSANWNTPQTVTVTGVDDAVPATDGDIAYNIVTAAAVSTDVTYNGINAADVGVTNNDNDVPGYSFSRTAGLVTTEGGGTDTFTVKLNTQPTGNVDMLLSTDDPAEGTVAPAGLTFTVDNWNTPQTVTVTGVNDDVDDGNIAYKVNTATAPTTLDLTYLPLVPPDVSVTNTDDDTAGVTITPTGGLITTEAGGTATFTVVLDSEPTADIGINLSSNNTDEGTIDKALLVFTNADWDTPQTVTITGVDDDLNDGDVSYKIITAAINAADPLYNSMNPADVSVTNTDDEIPGVTITPTSGLVTTEAGGTDTFTVVLDSEPTADVSLNLSSSDTGEGTIDKATLTFTSGNWDTPQTVTITGVDDDIDDGNITYKILTSATTSTDNDYNNLNPSDVAVVNNDDDVPGITVTPTGPPSTTEAGGTTTASIVLDCEPTADVTIPVSSSDTTEATVSPATVTFTSANWDTPQTITATGVDDDVVDGDIDFDIVFGPAVSDDPGYTGTDPADITITNNDDDVPGVTVNPTNGLVTDEGGATAQFTVVLDTQPTADVTIGLSSDTPAEGTVAPATLTFTSANWNTPQAVTVTGVDDVAVDGDVAYNIVTAACVSADLNYNGVNPSDVGVTNTDNDSAGFSFSRTSGLVTTEAGGTATFTIVLNTAPVAPVDITLTSSDTGEGTVSPALISFDAGNWNVPQTVTVTGVDDDVDDGDIAYTIETAPINSPDPVYNTMNPADVSVTNTDDDTAGVTVTPVAGLITTEAGGTDTFTVVLNSEPTADVTINVASSDVAEGTVNSATLTFSSANWDTPQTITVTGQDDSVDDGDIAYTINNSATSADPKYNGINVDDVDVLNTDDDTSYTLTVNQGTGDGSYVDGVAVPIVADAAQTGQTFDKWTGDTANIANINAASTTITMPAAATTVTATYTVDSSTASKVTCGTLITVDASEISGMDDEFTKNPIIYGKYTDPVSGREMKATTKGITKIGSTAQNNQFECEWSRTVYLYDKKARLTANKAGTSTADWISTLTNGKIDDLECELWAKASNMVKDKLDVSFRGVLIANPTITGVTCWDGSALSGGVHCASALIIQGTYFGNKPPTVGLEYTDAKGIVKLQRLKVLKPYKFTDSKGKIENSCMDLSSPTGVSEIRVEMPKKWWTGWIAGNYDLVLDNKIGLATYTIATTGTNADDPTANDDTTTLIYGDSTYYIDVLANDTDGDADCMSITLGDKTTSLGGKVAVSNGKVKYTPPRGVLPGAFPDTFTYSLSDGNGGTSGNATVTVNMNAITLDPVNHWDDTALTVGSRTVQPGSWIIICGKNFGIKAPTVTMAVEFGKFLKLKVISKPQYADYKGKANKSYTNVDSSSVDFGDSKITVELPKKAWDGYTDSKVYTITVSNKFDTTGADENVTTSAGNTAPTAKDDTVDIYSGEKCYYIDVLGNISNDSCVSFSTDGVDTDAESDKLTIVLPSRTSTLGAKLMVDKTTNMIKYTRAKDQLGDFSDTFTYSLIDAGGATSGPATVTVTGHLTP